MTNLTERTIQTETIVDQGNNYIQPDIGINQIISAFCFIHVCLRQIYWLIYEVTNLSKCYFPYICVSPPDAYYSAYKIFLLSAFQQMKFITHHGYQALLNVCLMNQVPQYWEIMCTVYLMQSILCWLIKYGSYWDCVQHPFFAASTALSM